MKKQGLVRLSVALSAAALAGGACCGTFGQRSAIGELEDFRAYMCVNVPDASPQELKKCAAELSVKDASPKKRHLTRETYWAEALGVALLMDLVLAAFVLGIAWVTRWVGRGFNVETNPHEPAAEPTRVSSATLCPDRDAGRNSTALFFPSDAGAPARTTDVPAFALTGSRAPQK